MLPLVKSKVVHLVVLSAYASCLILTDANGDEVDRKEQSELAVRSDLRGGLHDCMAARLHGSVAARLHGSVAVNDASPAGRCERQL